MTEEAVSHNEEPIRAAFAAGHLDEAANTALRKYGDEVFAFIASRLRDEPDSREAFSMFMEDLWLGLPRFAWRCSMRTWCYTLAHNAATRYARAPRRKAARNIPLSLAGVVPELPQPQRTATHPYQKTDVKDRFRALRERLDPEEQTLLVLRVDRNMSWRDLAIAMSGDTECDDETIARESARLRKAFERVKHTLRKLAESEGILEPKA